MFKIYLFNKFIQFPTSVSLNTTVSYARQEYSITKGNKWWDKIEERKNITSYVTLSLFTTILNVTFYSDNIWKDIFVIHFWSKQHCTKNIFWHFIIVVHNFIVHPEVRTCKTPMWIKLIFPWHVVWLPF